MQQLLKPFAIACKVIAIIEWLGVAWVTIGLDVSDLRAKSQPMYRDAPQDWGTPAYYHRTYLQIFVICVLVVLAVLPNRWFVSSRPAFGISLFVSFAPLWGMIVGSDISHFSDLIWLVILVALTSLYFSFLPLSLIFSFWRHKKGQKVTYA
jgi:hypothetical protein